MKHFILTLFLLSTLTLFSQEQETKEVSPAIPVLLESQAVLPEESVQVDKSSRENGFLSHLSVGLRASTMGIGLEAATPLNDLFKLRAGINFMGYTSNSFDIGLEDPNGAFNEAFGYIPDYSMKGKLNFTNGHALVDFHPTKGIFHLTAGFFVGKNQLKAEGFLADYDGNPAVLKDGQTWPTLDFDGHQLKTDNGRLDATLQLGNVIKPYFGLGLGRAIANKRVAFKFELGMIYQGKYSIKQNGKKVDVIDNAVENFEDIDTYTNLLKWWPMLNFQLTYKIF